MVCVLFSTEACLFWISLNNTSSSMGNNVYELIQEHRPELKQSGNNALTPLGLPHRNCSVFRGCSLIHQSRLHIEQVLWCLL